MSVQTLGSDEEDNDEVIDDSVPERFNDVVETGWEYRGNELGFDDDVALPAIESLGGERSDLLSAELGQQFRLFFCM